MVFVFPPIDDDFGLDGLDANGLLLATAFDLLLLVSFLSLPASFLSPPLSP